MKSDKELQQERFERIYDLFNKGKLLGYITERVTIRNTGLSDLDRKSFERFGFKIYSENETEKTFERKSTYGVFGDCRSANKMAFQTMLEFFTKFEYIVNACEKYVAIAENETNEKISSYDRIWESASYYPNLTDELRYNKYKEMASDYNL